MSDKPWTGKFRGGRFGNAFFAFLIRARLLWLASFFLFFVSLYFVVASPKGTRASGELAKRLGRRRLFFTWRHNFMFGTLLLERFAILSGHTDLFTFERPSREVIAPFQRGEGLVFVTAHVGSWEIMGHLLAHEESAPVRLVMHQGLQPRLRALLSQGRAFSVLESDGSATAAASILEALRRGEIVGMMGDRLLAEEGIAVEFLGGTARLPAGPFAVAAAARVPLVHAFAVRTGRRRYAFLAHEVGVPKRKERADQAQAFARRLEELVRRYPFQWGNFFPFWQD